MILDWRHGRSVCYCLLLEWEMKNFVVECRKNLIVCKTLLF